MREENVPINSYQSSQDAPRDAPWTGVVFPTNPERKAVGVLALYGFNWEVLNAGLEAAYIGERETAV